MAEKPTLIAKKGKKIVVDQQIMRPLTLIEEAKFFIANDQYN